MPDFRTVSRLTSSQSVAQCLFQSMESTAQPIARLGLAQLGPEQGRQPVAAVRPFLDGQVGQQRDRFPAVKHHLPAVQRKRRRSKKADGQL